MIRADYRDRAESHHDRLRRADRIAHAISEGVAIAVCLVMFWGVIAKALVIRGLL